jgi:hypothetical protein
MLTNVPASYRGLPLVTGGGASAQSLVLTRQPYTTPATGPGAKTVLTVEAYIKWYDVYGVEPSGRVRAIPLSLSWEFERDRPGYVAWSDHVPTPAFCEWLVTARGDRYEWDLVALDLIVGRWFTEGRYAPGVWDWINRPPAERARGDAQ